jgi:hypothetical protein
MSPVASDSASATSAAPPSCAVVPPADAGDVEDVVGLELLPHPLDRSGPAIGVLLSIVLVRLPHAT